MVILLGAILRHPQTRTVTETDNLLFNSLTMNPQPLHLDEHFAAKSVHGTRIVNGVFTLGLVVGIPVFETTLGTTLGHLAYTRVEFPAPVRHGDTLHVETEVIAVRASASKPDVGIVTLAHRGYNQDDVLVCDVDGVCADACWSTWIGNQSSARLAQLTMCVSVTVIPRVRTDAPVGKSSQNRSKGRNSEAFKGAPPADRLWDSAYSPQPEY